MYLNQFRVFGFPMSISHIRISGYVTFVIIVQYISTFIIKASFIKDDGKLFIIFNFIFSSLLVILVSRDLNRKGIAPCLLPKYFRASSSGVVQFLVDRFSFYCFNYMKHFVLNLSVGTFSAVCFNTFSWKKKKEGFLTGLVILVIKKYLICWCLCLMQFYLCFYAYFFQDL